MRETKMNKSTKGAVAAGAAAVLLLGGAGSLAYWNAESTIPGGSISSGTLTLTPKATGTWKLNGTTVTGTPTIVPGDELVYSGSYTIGATGNNIKGTLAVTGGTGTPWAGATVTPTFTLDSTTITGTTPITAAQNGKDVAAQIAVDFPFGTAVDNSSQAKTVNLSEIRVALVQTDASPAA
ncbi:alternate-type signal peptide domain-containing protein [Aeromicrobium duanguangcaii]|uniref:Alternate-type signal peptide domain-containing protein n=1 Tax=Aeromicrobium duanguangcaii TaxID=2968086 RepID=A0ABY5KH67_9ACTN|nr:alternate-type signal peptide domain-containing protein [Aeromicrobium duanguangcaii]MCD9153084.1 alternate-type signal peptide domain-containing protein [Aeromicrobium duanguangcaii]UUI69814.1 alternate-type signal peptide domain-containing protein [Aeromicrobium duanguangcaii]